MQQNFKSLLYPFFNSVITYVQVVYFLNEVLIVDRNHGLLFLWIPNT